MATIAHEGVATRTNAVATATVATATVATDGAARAARYVFAGVRIAIGTIFLWAFLDKTFGLGHATASKAAWLNGGHPTNGFLKGAVSGPFKGFYNGLAGSTFLDWLFMLGLLGLGLALISGVGVRVAAVAGSVLLVLMWSAVLPPANHVFMDDHLIYAGTLVGLALTNAGNTVGLGKRWGNTALVRKSPWLK